MHKIEKLKYDFTNNSEISICQACLSCDRKLSSIGEYVDIFRNLSYNVVSQAVYLCWECMSILKKIKLFKTQLEEAQRILRNQFDNKQKSLLKTLSKLTKSSSDNVIINITHNDDDNKEILSIKKENEQSDDDFNYDDHNSNDISLKKIKKEKVTPTRRVKKNKVSHYRIISDSNTKKVLRKKFSIKPDDPKIWLDGERNSDFYKSFRYKCNMCVHGFNCEKKLERHLLKHDESAGPHICSTCSMRFSTDTALVSHARTHNSAWQCVHCGFQCYTARRLKAHINTHRTVQCSYCDAQFPDVTAFYSHYKALHTVFLCDHCGKRCKTKYLLEKHMIHHVNVHPCASCSRRYMSVSALRKHMRAAHEHEHEREHEHEHEQQHERAYCVLCDKHYRSQHVYMRHVQTSIAHAHERDAQVTKKFPCPVCSNTYSRRVYMMNHYRHVHTNQSKYYCTQCDRHFLNRTRYVDHVRYNHEGVKKEKNKLCNVCGRGFATNRTLTNHLRTHSGERPYECAYCAASFTQRTSMLSHVRYIHMNNKRRHH